MGGGGGGHDPFSSFFGDFFGGGDDGGGERETPKVGVQDYIYDYPISVNFGVNSNKIQGADVVVDLFVTLEEVYNGHFVSVKRRKAVYKQTSGMLMIIL